MLRIPQWRTPETSVLLPKSGEDGNHYTLHAGPDSGIIDVHETQTLPDSAEQHRTLFALRRDDLPPLLQELVPMLPELLGLLRPLRLGWMKHRNIGIDPVSDDDIAAVTRNHRRRLTLDAQKYEQNVFIPEFLEEVYDFPDGNLTSCIVPARLASVSKKRCRWQRPPLLDEAPRPHALRS